MRSLLPLLALSACIEYEPVGENLPPPLVANPKAPPATIVTDTFVQVTAPKVDVLWVIDDSCSMDDEQQAIVDNYDAFMDYFLGSALDYHIGVVSTSRGDDGALVASGGARWIDPETPDPFGTFADMALLGVRGSGCEQGLATSFLALEVQQDAVNDGFLRDDAAIHTIVISDEPDQSDGDPVTKDEYVDWYDGLKPSVEDRSFSAIASTNPQADCSEYPVNFFDVVAEIGGIGWDITDRDWRQVLDLLGLQASGLRREYFLSQLPDPTTLDVSVEEPGGAVRHFVQGAPPEGDYTWSLERNSVFFHGYVPLPGAVVTIRYVPRSSGFEIEETISEDSTD